MNANHEIERLLTVMEAAMQDNEKLAVAAGEAEVAYKLAHAKAILTVEFPSTVKATEALRKAKADLACKDELLDHKIADALHGANSERLRTIRASLDSLRTLSANERVLSAP